MDSPAFTLIELLIVIALIGILTAAAIPSFQSFTTSQRLSQAAKQVKQDLRSAQNRAISSVEGMAWGVNVSDGSTYYTIFKCDPSVGTGSYTLTQCPIDSIQVSLPSDFTIQDPTAFSNLVFDVVSGDLYVDGTLQTSGGFSFQVDLDGSRRTITVSAGGKIEEQ